MTAFAAGDEISSRKDIRFSRVKNSLMRGHAEPATQLLQEIVVVRIR
jgi:hypothetical protein